MCQFFYISPSSDLLPGYALSVVIMPDGMNQIHIHSGCSQSSSNFRTNPIDLVGFNQFLLPA